MHNKNTGRKAATFKRLALASTALVGLALPISAQAQEWTGATSADWFDAGNWTNPGHVPTAADDVIIDNNVQSPTITGVGKDGVANHIIVGDANTGTLNVSSGATVTNVKGTIGANAGSSGIVTIDGIGSKWTNTGILTIGDVGVGTLDVTNGGTVTSNQGFLGWLSSSSGTMTVDGAGSSWINTGYLNVGANGTAFLTISNGGKVENTLAAVGAGNGSGTVTVAGAGSTWINTGDLTIGQHKAGSLTISNGGNVSNLIGYIGNIAGATGTVKVSGTGSKWTNSSDLHVGEAGSGTLNVTNGGNVTNADGFIGAGAGGSGLVTVDGPGSVWTNSGSLYVGNDGSGTLDITNGGEVNAGFTSFGSSVGTTGIGKVDGPGSTLAATGNLTVGSFGYGDLTISNGGKVSNLVGTIAATSGVTGAVMVEGAGSNWTTTSLTVGAQGLGVLNLDDGGKVNSATGTVGAQVGSQGVVAVREAGSVWTVTNDLIVGDSGKGSLLVDNGAKVSVGGELVLANQAGSTGGLTLSGTIPGMVDATTVRFGAGTGRLSFDHDSTNYSFTAAITGLGTINQADGITRLTADSSGFTGLTHVNGGTLLVDGKLGTGAIDVKSGGTLGGKGSIGGTVTVASGGILSGIQGQTLTVQNLDLTSGANVNVTLSAPGGAALFDVVNDLTLDGTLNITSSGMFGPGVYGLMTYGGTLTDNGLDIGGTPAGSTGANFTVQTSVAGKVNLVSTALPNLAFWDGDGAGNADNNMVDGGSGVWTATSTNWTEANGTTNGVMHPQPTFAIFQGTAGTVTADASAGAISVTGMQFATDGYQLTGAPITLADSHSIIRVGDGTGAGANYKATIDSVLTGSGGLDKTDLGTLILTADNTYTGGTTISDGTLQLGNGGTSGSVTGDIVNNGLLIFNRSDVWTYAGAISGTGAILKSGSGTLNLTGNSSGFPGGVQVDAGTLGVNSGGSLNSSGLYVGSTAGSTGAFSVDGASSTASSATVLIGVAGDGTLNVTNGGKLSNAGDGALGLLATGKGTATITGAGSSWTNAGNLYVGVAGTGTLTLSNGAVASTGGTALLAGQAGSTGTLNIGSAAGSAAQAAGTLNAGTLEFGQGTGTLNFNHTDTSYTFAASMLGAGTIDHYAGVTSLTGNSGGFTGAVNVKGGRLAVNGLLGGGDVTVSNGAGLSGIGTIGDLTAQSGALVAPGNGGVGTLTVKGNASLAAGSTYRVDLASTGQSDLLKIEGTATLANGALLSVVKTDATPYVLGAHYTVLTADLGLTGAFTLDNTQLTNFMGLVGSSDANNYYIDITKTKTFASAGLTANQIATAGGLDTLPPGGTLASAVASLSSDAAAQYAFDQLSGEVHASARTVMIEDSRFLRSAVNDRLRAAFGGVGASGGKAHAATADKDGGAVWGQAFGSWGQWNSDGNAARLDRSIGGFFMGADAPVFDNWRFGAVAGYSRTSFNAEDRHSSGTSDNYSVGLYGGTTSGDLAFRSGAAYTWHDIATSRNVSFSGLSDSLSAGYRAGTAQVFGELGYKMQAGNVALEPFANLAYVNLRTDGFTERGGVAALAGGSSTIDTTFTTLGLRAASSFDLNGVSVTARGMVGWRHAFGDTTPDSVMSFAGSAPFSIGGVPIARNVAVVDLGLDMNLSASRTLGISYGGQFGSGVNDQTLRASFNVKF